MRKPTFTLYETYALFAKASISVAVAAGFVVVVTWTFTRIGIEIPHAVLGALVLTTLLFPAYCWLLDRFGTI